MKTLINIVFGFVESKLTLISPNFLRGRLSTEPDRLISEGFFSGESSGNIQLPESQTYRHSVWIRQLGSFKMNRKENFSKSFFFFLSFFFWDITLKMGRITEMMAYLNSTAKDWSSGNISYGCFKYYEITEVAKKIRKNLLKLKN